MKEIDGWVKIKKYTDDEGKPVCGECIVFNGEEVCQFEHYPYLGVRNEATPGPTCPIWHGESNRDIEVVERMQAMCEESLDPERFDAWENIKNQLFSTRSSLHHRRAIHDR